VRILYCAEFTEKSCLINGISYRAVEACPGFLKALGLIHKVLFACGCSVIASEAKQSYRWKMEIATSTNVLSQ
jgi:hypothetical protein